MLHFIKKKNKKKNFEISLCNYSAFSLVLLYLLFPLMAQSKTYIFSPMEKQIFACPGLHVFNAVYYHISTPQICRQSITKYQQLFK